MSAAEPTDEMLPASTKPVVEEQISIKFGIANL
jgi:hypothetical protein